MITYMDQMDIFSLISKQLKENVDCYAFGGTAMMFYGYKDETKDIDLFFEKEDVRKAFIKALEKLGFAETSPMKIYIPEKLRSKNRPLMLKREDSRFDLFVEKIFHTTISKEMREEVYAVHEFKESYTLKVYVLRKEFIVMLKAVTERQNDFDDIKLILQKEKHFDWQLLIDEVIWQYKHGDSWVLLDMHKTLQELRKYVFVQEKYLKQLEKATENMAKRS